MTKKASNNNELLIFTSSFFPVMGGVQTVAKEIGMFIKSKGWNVTLITNRYPRRLNKKDVIENLLVYRFTFLQSPFNYIKSLRFDLFLAWICYKPITCIRLIILFLQVKPKIVNVHFPDNQIFETFVLKRLFSFKLILSIHGNDIHQMKYINKKNLKYKLFQKLLNEASLITTCSDFLKNQTLDVFPKSDKKKFYTLHNGVSDIFLKQNFSKEKGNFLFSVGRFVPVKGFDLLAKVSENFPKIEFQLGGGYKKDFLNLAPEHDKEFNFLGQLNLIECFDKYSTAKITIVPSKNESYGIVVAEALCCGSPIVATNVGGIPEVVDLAKSNLNQHEISIFNNWVKLVEPNVNSLIAGINEILENYSSLGNYLELIPKIQNNFFWRNRLKKYHQHLMYLVSQ